MYFFHSLSIPKQYFNQIVHTILVELIVEECKLQ